MSNTIIWIAGHTLLERRFADRLVEEGIDAVLDECPYDDLADDERATLEAVIAQPALCHIIDVYWTIYDTLRKAGKVPATRSPWMP